MSMRKELLTLFSLLLVVACMTPLAQAAITITASSTALSNFDVRGALSKGSGTFVIDHPQRPATKLLYHSFVESPDVKNLYDGIATLDSKGEAVIELPDYFEALNYNFRYQFFALGEPMPNLYIKEEEKNNQFTIAGGVPGGRVSWQITGIREDPYIEAYPPRIEVVKGPKEIVDKGECIFEPLCK